MWSSTTGGFSRKSYGYEIKIPESWYIRNGHKFVQLTRDGTELECISIKTWKWGDTLNTKHQKISKNLLLHEIPHLFLSGMTDCDFTVLEENIIMIDNVPCTKTLYSFRIMDTVLKKGILVCCPFSKHIITYLYTGCDRYYFQSQEKAFYSIINSINFK